MGTIREAVLQKMQEIVKERKSIRELWHIMCQILVEELGDIWGSYSGRKAHLAMGTSFGGDDTLEWQGQGSKPAYGQSCLWPAYMDEYPMRRPYVYMDFQFITFHDTKREFYLDSSNDVTEFMEEISLRVSVAAAELKRVDPCFTCNPASGGNYPAGVSDCDFCQHGGNH